MTDEFKVTKIHKQLVHDVACQRIYFDKRGGHHKGTYRQLYEGVLGPMPPRASACLRELEKAGWIEPAPASKAMRLCLPGKLRLAEWTR